MYSNQKINEFADALNRLGDVCREIIDIAEELLDDGFEGPERMKNCVNCDHREVCVVVARRKAQHANDYTPCGKWKLVEK